MQPKYHKCSLPWCTRSQQTLNDMNMLWKGRKLMVCNFHQDCYEDNKEGLWNKLNKKFKPIMARL